MFGVYIGKNGESIERVKKNNEELCLLAKGEGIEIMLQTIDVDSVFYIDPGEEPDTLEFFYIIEGEIAWESENGLIILKPCDYFYLNNIKETTFLKVNRKATMLYVANQAVFHLLSNEILKFEEMRQKVETKDGYTHNHGFRVMDYSLKIGNELNFTKNQLNILANAAVFHDLGKINVPDDILKKPSYLAEEEFEYIKMHPLDGSDFIKNTFLKDSALAILQHHERDDGSGYPNCLGSHEICMEAKIIGVVDTFDAMISERPYSEAKNPHQAINEIKSLMGILYDEKVVLAFEKILKEEGII